MISSLSLTRSLGLAVLLGAVAFAVSALFGLQVASRDRIVPGVLVLGVPVGGLTVQDATTRLVPTSAAILDQPLQLQAGSRSWTTTPRALGMQLDPGDLASSAFRLGHGDSTLSNLTDELGAIRAQQAVPISTATDGLALQQLIERIATDLDTQPQSAQLTLADDGTLSFQSAHTGLALDQVASRSMVAKALADGLPGVALPTRVLAPDVDTSQVAAAHDELVRILADPSPVQLSAGQQHATIERPKLLELLSLSPPDGPNTVATVEVKDEPVQALVQSMAAQVDRDAQDARFSMGSDGQLTLLRPSLDGQALNQPAAAAQIKTSIVAGERAADLPVDVVHPAVANEDAARLGIRDLVGESTTSFAGSIPEKAHNIQLAAQRLNGVVVPPGGTFSFNKEVGPTTLEAGFQWGFGLTTGSQGAVHTVPSVAGGICQVATTLFQPVFWSGYQLEERYWHLYWIPAYTSRGLVGLDATVDADSGLDFKWINPTRDPVLIQASTDAEHITFKLFGHKPDWTVQVDDPVITDKVVADPTPEVQEEPSMPWGRTLLVESARDGFSVLLTRHVTPTDGSQPRELALKSVYAPAHTVTLVGSGGAPDGASVSAAVDQVRARQQVAAAPAAVPGASAPPAPPATHDTPNGPRTMTQIRDELRQAGWGGGSDQDAIATYERLASAAQH